MHFVINKNKDNKKRCKSWSTKNHIVPDRKGMQCSAVWFFKVDYMVISGWEFWSWQSISFASIASCMQSHYRQVPQWEIFMEQELRFGLDLGQMANFPGFIASKSFDLWNHHIPQMKWYDLWHILMYQKYMKFKKEKK